MNPVLGVLSGCPVEDPPSKEKEAGLFQSVIGNFGNLYLCGTGAWVNPDRQGFYGELRQ